MIKQLSEFKTQKNSAKLNTLLQKEISFYEKLDTFYFNIQIKYNSNSGYNEIKFYKSNGKEIDLVERILNKMWEEPISYFNKIPNVLNDNINIGIYYFPSEMPINTNYKKLFDKSKYYYNTCYLINDKKKTELDFNIAEFYKIPKYEKLYTGLLTLSCIKDVYLYLNDNINEISLVKTLINDIDTFSGNSIEDIEGLILKTNKSNYQIIINEPPKQDLSLQYFYYDMFIIDFIAYIKNNNVDDLISNNYIQSVCNLFIDYINKTDFVKKYIIEDNNLEFPHIGYYGGLNFDLLNNEIVKTICVANPIYKNMFTVLLSGLRYKKKPHSVLTEQYCIIWNNLQKRINGDN